MSLLKPFRKVNFLAWFYRTYGAALSSTDSDVDWYSQSGTFHKTRSDPSEYLTSDDLVTYDPSTAYNLSSSRNLTVPIEDQACSFFFHHYVAEGNPSPNSRSSFLPILFNRQFSHRSAGNPLPAIITAIGMAGLSNVQNSAAGTIATRQKHSSVLRTLTAALQDPETRTADSTLMAVMLLGTFEQVTCTNPQALKSWANHVTGAVAIARARGQNQVQTEVGRDIFTHLRNQIIIDCFQRDKAVPPEIMEWADRALKFDNSKANQRETELFKIIARLCNLRAAIHTSEGSSLKDPVVLSLAKDIDTDLSDFANAIPPWLGYSLRTCRISENVFSDYYHVYPNTWVVGAWNMCRGARIMTQETILDWLEHNPDYEGQDTQKRECEILLGRLAADICASVPFVLRDAEPEEDPLFRPQAVAGIALVWPLYLTATMDTATESTRAWVISRLDKLGHMMGIQQAVSLARVLRTQRTITAWRRFESTRADEELVEW
ncbi:hypothetical protein ACLMJK_001049 [Lecanora helva]